MTPHIQMDARGGKILLMGRVNPTFVDRPTLLEDFQIFFRKEIEEWNERFNIKFWTLPTPRGGEYYTLEEIFVYPAKTADLTALLRLAQELIMSYGALFNARSEGSVKQVCVWYNTRVKANSVFNFFPYGSSFIDNSNELLTEQLEHILDPFCIVEATNNGILMIRFRSKKDYIIGRLIGVC